MPKRIHVDFNDIELDDRLTALVEHADGEVAPGNLVVLYDADSNKCRALVLDVFEDGTVALLPDWSTWNKTMLDALTELMERASGRKTGWPFDASAKPVTGFDEDHLPGHNFHLIA
jgi:hypothetical protein